MMTTPINKLEIPIIPTKVTSFINADIDFMTKEEGSVFYRQLENIAQPSVEPLFAVKEGDGRFIYSFSKLLKPFKRKLIRLKIVAQTLFSMLLWVFLFGSVLLFIL